MTTRMVLSTLVPALLLAQERQALTIEEAIQLGLQNNKGLHIAAARATAADAKARETNAARLPSLKLQAGYTRLSDVEPFAVALPSAPGPVVISPTVVDHYTSKLALLQPLFTGFRLESAAAAAVYAAESAKFDIKQDRVETVYQVKAAYWNVYKTREIQRVLRDNGRQMSAHLADVEQLLAQGLVTSNEVLKVEVQRSSVRLAEIEASNSARSATMTLATLLGLPLTTEFEITSAVVAPTSAAPALDSLTREALEGRGDLKSAVLRVNAAEASAAAVRGGWWPQVTLFANAYYARPNPRVLPTKDVFKDSWDVGVSVSWDVWNWGTTKHQSEQAEAAREQAGYAGEQMRDNVALEVHHSVLSREQSKEKVGVAAKSVEQGEENYRLTKSKFSRGTATNTDVLDAEMALLQAKLNYTLAVVERAMAEARLLKALGREA